MENGCWEKELIISTGNKKAEVFFCIMRVNEKERPDYWTKFKNKY
jgi:hypothetical protein